MTKYVAVAAAALLLASFGAQAATTVNGPATAKSGIVVASDSNKCIYNPRNCKP